MKTVQVYDGKWYRLGMHELHECCDCGLVHRVDHQLRRGVIFERWAVDVRETRKARAELAKSKPTRARKRR